MLSDDVYSLRAGTEGSLMNQATSERPIGDNHIPLPAVLAPDAVSGNTLHTAVR